MAKSGSFELVTITNQSRPILPMSNNRRTIMVFPQGGTTFWLGFGKTVGANSGITVPATGTPVKFTRDEIGSLIDTELIGIAAAASITVAILVGYD